MLANKLTGSGAAAITYVDDVFSAYTYTGNGSTQTINNGIDLAGKGGMVWIKSRYTTASHTLYDTVRGVNKVLYSDSTSSQDTNTAALTAFNPDGFSLNATGGYVNVNSRSEIAWTFRKAPKFFDVVTYTGNGVAGRTIAHNLGVAPGMIIVKCTSQVSQWPVQHIGVAASQTLYLNQSAAAGATNDFNSTAATSSIFSVGGTPQTNSNGDTYVAYLFAHDASTDGIVQCGAYTTNGSGIGSVTLGWEPQYVLAKRSDSTGSWYIFDTSRTFIAAPNASNTLAANTSGVESALGPMAPTATGFFDGGALAVSATIIYLAIRRPNKPPTTGTQVYNAIARTGTGAAATVTGVGFAPDLVFSEARSAGYNRGAFDRLRGINMYLGPNITSAEAVPTDAVTAFSMDGVSVGADTVQGSVNNNTISYINHFFKRAPGVMDEICFSGTGANKTESHGLGVAPELWLVKGRSGATQWVWGSSLLAATEKIVMPTPAGKVTDATAWNSTYPTSSVLSLGTAAAVNTNAATYVAYLWATKTGISKVFAYTGNGSSQNIDCGFTTGARFILIVRTSAAGSVYVWDTVRGVIAGNDPYLALDTIVAEVTTDDSVDPLASGFTVNQVAATNINVTSATYIGLAYA